MKASRLFILCLSFAVLQACGGGGNDVAPDSGKGGVSNGDETAKQQEEAKKQEEARKLAEAKKLEEQKKKQEAQAKISGPDWTPATSYYAKVPDELVAKVKERATMDVPVDDFDNEELGMVGGRFSVINPNGYHEMTKYVSKAKKSDPEHLYVCSGNYSGFVIMNLEDMDPVTGQVFVKDSELVGIRGLNTTKEDFDKIGGERVKYEGVAKGWDHQGVRIDGKAEISIGLADRKVEGVIRNAKGLFGMKTPLLKSSIHLFPTQLSYDSKGQVYVEGDAAQGDFQPPFMQPDMNYRLNLYGPEANEIAGYVTNPDGKKRLGVHATRKE